MKPATKTVRATSFLTASADDWATAVEIGNRHYVATAGAAVLRLLRSQRDDPRQGWPVNNHQHSLQCASRALRRGEDEEFVVCALLRDIGQKLNPFGHDNREEVEPLVRRMFSRVMEERLSGSAYQREFDR